MAFERLDDLTRTFKVAPEHRSTAVNRPAISINPHDIDIRCPLGLTFFEDFIPLVDHRIERSFNDLLLADFTLRQIGCRAKLFDNSQRLRTRRADAFCIIVVETLAVFLAEASGRA